ncbi:MAG: chromosomal replication initiator protein DnaA [Chloroflexota bacterium]|nr:chromosomal replication initiator protein DnaA [Chloroflexota bacterium]
MQGSRVWQAVLEDLQGRTPRGSYETFLRSTEIADFNADTARLTVAAPNTFVREHLEKRFHGPIVRSLRGILGYEVEVDFTVLGRPANEDTTPGRKTRADDRGSDIPTIAPSPKASMFHEYQQPELTPTPAHGLNPRYTFDHLIVSGFNRMAAAGAKSVADTPGHSYNPLFIYGGVGLGKTHILHAIGHYAMEHTPGCRVLYVSSETFTNEMINAIRENRNEEFRTRYRTIDILLIDDIQFIAGKESTQEEFFHTFNALVLAGKQIVMTSDRHPKVIVTLDDRLRSRFEGGLTTDVQTPDLESRMAILRQRGEEAGVHVPTEVVDYIAHKVQSNVRELEGALNRIVMTARMNGVAVTMDVATQALNDVALNNRRRLITPARIVEVVAKFYNCSEKEMRGRGRSKDIVVPRQVAMYIIRHETDRSLADIGTELGGRDHTTVIHGTEKVEKEIERGSGQLRQEVLTIREMLYAD